MKIAARPIGRGRTQARPGPCWNCWLSMSPRSGGSDRKRRIEHMIAINEQLGYTVAGTGRDRELDLADRTGADRPAQS